MFEVIELSRQEAQLLEERITRRQLNDRDYDLLVGLLNTFSHLNHLLEEKKLSLKRLLRLFWNKSEKSEKLFKKDNVPNEFEAKLEANRGEAGVTGEQEHETGKIAGHEKESGKAKKPGHGRNGSCHRICCARHALATGNIVAAIGPTVHRAAIIQQPLGQYRF